MFYKTFVIVILCATHIGSQKNLKFRFDYTFSEGADGWLKYHEVPDTWIDAKDRCQYEGAVLASPLTPQLQAALLKHVSNQAADVIFTGVHATFSQGDYASVEGKLLLWMDLTWSPGEPNNVDNSESCLAMMTRNGNMADVKCTDALPYICYRKRTELIITECGTHDKDYHLERTGNCYKLHKRGLIWPKAYTACLAEGGYLAIMNSNDESALLKEIFTRANNKELFVQNTGACHVGLCNFGDGGSWLTIHGQTMEESGYSQWGGGQPDNATGGLNAEGEFCGSIFRDGTYNDVWCRLSLAFICEKDPKSLD